MGDGTACGGHFACTEDTGGLDAHILHQTIMKYYILVETWAVYVKGEQFFIDQGGLNKPWGKEWIKVEAPSIEGARKLGETMEPYKSRNTFRSYPW